MLKKATIKQIQYYEKELYPFQDEILKFICSDMFYLSDGTCLSRFYYDHRFSDDLDFFFDGYKYPKEEFDVVYRKIVTRINKHFQADAITDSIYFKRIVVNKGNLVLKVEFIFENFKTIGLRKKINEIFIDTKENIATNKITAAQDCKTLRDFVDLYYLLQEIKLEKIIEWAK